MARYNEVVRIFLVDDDEDDRLIFSEALNEVSTRHEYREFRDGKELVDYFADPENPLPHIIFLDLNMPLMDGKETLAFLRNSPRFKEMSIAIFSSSDSDADIEHTFVLGANIFIRKPTGYEKLKKTIKAIVEMDWQYHDSKLNRETYFATFQ